jgi:hypothetical protein
LFGTIATIVISGFALWADVNIKAAYRTFNKATAFSAAEAGIEYYRWHLAHAPTDFWDGRGATSTGPYVHAYYDKNGNQIGQFSLAITPPATGSTVVALQSVGKASADATVQKAITVRFAKASFAKYAWAEGASDVFGTDAEVFGPIRINGGLHFDGIAHNLVETSFTHYDHGGEAPSGDEWGIHTNRGTDDPAWPTALQNRSDVFMAGRSVGVLDLNYDQMTQDLASIKNAAVSSSLYFASSGVKGYELVFATSGRFTVNKVTATSTRGTCNYERWSVQTVSSTVFASGTIPQNGSMFFEDNLWVRGKINGKRVTVGAGRFPDSASTRKNITVNSDLLYTRYDCSDSIALIAQNNLNIGYSSENDLRIDAALVAQNGSIGRDSYSASSCGASSTRNTLIMYGTFVNKFIRGLSTYDTRTYIYDQNLLYCPPPGFPLTTDKYSQVSWDESQ